MRKQTRSIGLGLTESANLKHPLDKRFATRCFNRMAASTECSPAPRRAAFAPSGQYKQVPSDSKDQFESRSQIDAKWLAQDKKLLEKLAILLKHQNPPVTDLMSAAQGFRDFGQFVAAVDLSHNLRVPFDHVKTQMLATPRLGKIAHNLDRDADR